MTFSYLYMGYRGGKSAEDVVADLTALPDAQAQMDYLANTQSVQGLSTGLANKILELTTPNAEQEEEVETPLLNQETYRFLTSITNGMSVPDAFIAHQVNAREKMHESLN